MKKGETVKFDLKNNKKLLILLIITAVLLIAAAVLITLKLVTKKGIEETAIEEIYDENEAVLNDAYKNSDFAEQTILTGENGKFYIDVPYISQASYPSGCESVSTVMALNYAGINISVDNFIKSYLPYTEFTYSGGKLYGYHPDNFFMGDPFTTSGFGCYAPCIEKAVTKFLPDDYTLQNTTGKSIDYLCENYIKKGVPVIFWATVYMVETSTGPGWTLRESGSIYHWVNNEHCLLLVGFDNDYYYFNDPIAGRVRYAKSLVEARYKDLGYQSLVVFNKNGVTTEANIESGEDEIDTFYEEDNEITDPYLAEEETEDYTYYEEEEEVQ